MTHLIIFNNDFKFPIKNAKYDQNMPKYNGRMAYARKPRNTSTTLEGSNHAEITFK